MLTDNDELPIDIDTSKQKSTEEEPLLELSDSDLFDIKESDDSDLFDIKESDEKEHTEATNIPSAGQEASDEPELLDLLLPEEADNAIEQIQEKVQTPSELAASQSAPIYIDIERISEKIGISTDDYNLFLNEYIDTALALEEALQSENNKEQIEALAKLSHLSNVLHLPFVSDILTQIENTTSQERDKHIESFFSTLGRLSTAHFEEEMPLTDKDELPKEQIQQSEEVLDENKRAPIDLSDIKPIHFDFQLEAAAEDLSLPVELIEEFVGDFIQQAHEETKKMLAAYEKGDLETVQKIGHLLKGTSSNLRITQLSDTLYEIQFNEDIERVPELVRNYWAHFLSLENQFKLISNT
ncbi:hypothetical protein MNB_SV-4-683 [hydrothermal vent metagenome]|uniref:HPt domain-containing protein n=1 Tax=hydrothermal vent metagenome TaxID=652676 RepID=A0A1W1EAF0_9ZZZZ